MLKRKIIDFHVHLGTQPHQNYNCIFQQNIEDVDIENDLWREWALNGYNVPPMDGSLEQFNQFCNSSFEAHKHYTVQRHISEMDANGITYSVILPHWPVVPFELYLAASKMDSRYILFTTPDLSLSPSEIGKKLLEDVKKGAKGLKINAVASNICYLDPRVIESIKAWEQTGMPVYLHVGEAQFFRESDPWKTISEYGNIKYFLEVVPKFPDVTFIAAHAGGFDAKNREDELAAAVGSRQNIYVDTTYRSISDVRKLVRLFGADRVIFGTDLPLAPIETSIKSVVIAFKDDPVTLNKLLYENAARLLRLSL